jgi:hypothetical protein
VGTRTSNVLKKYCTMHLLDKISTNFEPCNITRNPIKNRIDLTTSKFRNRGLTPNRAPQILIGANNKKFIEI